MSMVKQILYKGGLAFTFLIVCYCLYCSVFLIAGNATALSPVVLILGAVILGFFIIRAYSVIRNFSDRELLFLNIILSIIFVSGLLYFGFSLKNIPAYDLNCVHSEAEYIVRNGERADVLYFSRYTNNVGILLVLTKAFEFADFIGVKDFRNAGIVLGSIAIYISVLFGALCCYKIKGKYIASLYMLISVLSPAYYLFASYYYTDVLSLPFFTLGVFLYLLAFDKKKGSKSIGYYILAGAVLAFGMEVRATLGIVFIAAIVAVFFKGNICYFVKSLIAILLGVIIGFGIGNILTAPYEITGMENREFPITHWVMMGLNNTNKGAYSAKDFAFTDSFPTYEEKVENTVEQIKIRAAEMGARGWLSLVKQKIARVWTDGWYGADLHIKNLEKYSDSYDYIRGSKKVFFRYYLQMHMVLIWLSVAAFLIWLFKGNKVRNIDNNMLVITLFGAFLFYCIWEAERRYSFSFLPLFIMICSGSISETGYIIWRKTVTMPKCFVVKWLALGSVALISILNFEKYTVKDTQQRAYSINQDSSYSECTMKSADSQLKQTFLTGKPFDKIIVNAVIAEEEKFAFELWDENNCIAEGDVDVTTQKTSNNLICAFEEVVPLKEKKYELVLYPSEQREVYNTKFQLYSKKNYAILKNAEFSAENVTVEAKNVTDTTLRFSVFESYKAPIYSIPYYLITTAVVLLIINWVFKKESKLYAKNSTAGNHESDGNPFETGVIK